MYFTSTHTCNIIPLSFLLGWCMWTDEPFKLSPCRCALSNGAASPSEWLENPLANNPLSSDCGTLPYSTSDLTQNFQDSCTTHMSTKVPTRHNHATMMQTTLYIQRNAYIQTKLFFFYDLQKTRYRTLQKGGFGISSEDPDLELRGEGTGWFCFAYPASFTSFCVISSI